MAPSCGITTAFFPVLAADPGAAFAAPVSAISAAQWVAIGLVAGGLLIIVAVLVGVRRGRTPGATPPPRTPPADPAMTATIQEAERLLRLMGEAEELCARLGNDLDDRASRLESLLSRADAALEAPHEAPPPPVRLAVTPRATPVARPVEAPVPPQSLRPEDGGHRPDSAPAVDPHRGGPVTVPIVTIPPRVVTRPVEVPAGPTVRAAAPPERAAATPVGLDTLAGQVYALADQGFTPVDIAQRLGQHTGKVELILALRD